MSGSRVTMGLYQIAKFYREILLNRLAKVNPSPVVIIGNQKTGTTAIAALLAQFSGVSVTLDIRGIYEPVQTDLHKKKISFGDFVQSNKLDFSREIVKEPCLTYLYHELEIFFPDSRVIFVNRDPRSNLKSILNRLSLPGDLYQLKEQHLKTISPEWKLALDGNWMGLKGGNYIEMLAARWNRAADTYLENASNMALIRYEDFCENKVDEIAGLARRVGLEPVNDIAGRVDYPYQRRGDRSTSWKDFFGPGNLARIECICGGRMKKFNYEPGGG